jgi:two-component system, NarL family, sensor histidine kinase DevS
MQRLRPTEPASEITSGRVLAQTKQLQALHVIACALSGSLDTSEVLNRAVQSLLEVTGLSSGCVYLYDEERQLLVSHSPVGFLHELGPLELHRPDTSSFPSRAFRARQPLVFDVSDERYGYSSITDVERRTIIPEGIRTAIACRIESSSTNYGVVVVCSRDPKQQIEGEDLEFTKVVAGQIGVAIERARLYEDLERRMLEATTLYEIGRTLGSHVETESVLPTALDLASLRFGFASCEVELREPLGDKRRFGGPGGPSPDHPGVAAVSALLAVGDVELGRLLAFDADPPPEDTHRRVRAMADLIAMAVWNSRLTKDRARLGLIEERNRLARELHDGLTQHFYAIQLQLQSAVSALEVQDTDSAVRQVEVAASHAHDGLDEARRSVRGLRERGIENHSLTDLLHDLATHYEQETGTRCQLIIRGDDRLTDTDIKSAIALSVKELLHNVEKHAAAASVSVVLAFASDALSVNVADDGHGFTLSNPANANTGYGLLCVRERMVAIGGRMDIRSVPGQGTVAHLVVPRSAS